MKPIIFELHDPNTATRFFIENQWEDSGIHYVSLQLECEAPTVLQPISLSFSLPSFGLHSTWSPQTDANGMRKLSPNWNKKTTNSRFAHGLPLHAVMAVDGENRMTVAVSDVKTPLSIATGISEEQAELDCKLTFFTQLTAPLTTYRAVIRIDLRPLPFYETIPQAVQWWEQAWSIIPAPVPEAAREPVNSLWYSFHQQLNTEEILKECLLSKPFGLNTVILDDGWQTEDNNRGYAWCGDWELATKKIPDMRRLSDELHSLGMQLMLWYSVPYMGVHAKNFVRFRDMLLYFDERRGCGALDPRYACVREYLVRQYETAVRDWDLDGLKLDFVNAFKLTDKTPVHDPRRDIESLEEAIETLLQEIDLRLRRLKPELLIEFRQGYIGPAMRSYGNMLRAGDCPNDALCNRTAVLDLRLTSGRTPVHSDMLMWHPEEPAEQAALQLASVLFSVPQISLRLERTRAQQKKMLAFYLELWRQNKSLLLDGSLRLYDPQAFYSKASAQLGEESFTVLYTANTVQRETEKTTLVNCGQARTLYLEGFGGCAYRVVNCMGEAVSQGILENLSGLSVPAAGVIYL